MPARDSPSPSPPPTAPMQTTPGPRAAALHKIYSGALRATLSANSYENFSSCFPTPAKYCPTALEGVWKQLNSRLQEECMKDFEKICTERDVVQNLNTWDRAVEEAQTRKARAIDGEEPGRAPHTLSGDELYTAHLTPYLLQAEKDLQNRLQKTQKQNLEKMSDIQRQRDELEQLLNGLEMMVRDVEGSATALEKNFSDEGDLRSDIQQMQQDKFSSRT